MTPAEQSDPFETEEYQETLTMNTGATNQEAQFREWANVELFGHQRVIGLVTEAQIAGAKFLRIEALNKAGETSTRFYGPTAIYCITPCTEQIARGLATNYGEDPIRRFDIAKLATQDQRSLPLEDLDFDAVEGGQDDGP